MAIVGSTLSDRKYQLSVKYEKHIRFLLGTASVLLRDGTGEGRRAQSFEYTDRWVCTHRNFLVHRLTEMARVRALEGDGAPWVTGHRSKDDGIFNEDDVSVLARIGTETAKKLKSVGNITTVEDVASLLDDDIETLAEENGLSFGVLDKAREHARIAARRKYEGVVTDHKKIKIHMSRGTGISGWMSSMRPVT